MSEELEGELFEESGVGTPAAIAARLRELANQIETGRFMLGTQMIALPERLTYEIEYEQEEEDGELECELEFELKWTAPVSGKDDEDEDEDDEDEDETT